MRDRGSAPGWCRAVVGLLGGWPFRWSSLSRPRQRALQKQSEEVVHIPEPRPVLGPELSVVDARILCMTTAFDDTGQHPVTSAIVAVSQQLHDVAYLGLWTLRPAET